MLRKIMRIVGFLIGCGVIFAYILFASTLAQKHRAEQRVEEIVVSMVDSTSTQQFATSESIHRQLKKGGFRIENKVVDSVDAVKISRYITNNGFVRDADVYVTYSGQVYIDVKQHKPIMRLLCSGVDSYITADGDIFRSPKGSAYYTAVVTGGYKPMFSATFEGNFSDYYASLVEIENEKLSRLGGEFAKLKQAKANCIGRRAELRKSGKQKLFESDDSYRQRKVGVDADIIKCGDELKQLKAREVRLEKQQKGIEVRKKKLYENYADFVNLINFVTEVDNDSFWRAEVVQFVADTTSTGSISMRLVPRSGDFIIEFGMLEDRAKKLAKLQEFYDGGLSRIGWDRYSIVDVRYDNQVICTE